MNFHIAVRRVFEHSGELKLICTIACFVINIFQKEAKLSVPGRVWATISEAIDIFLSITVETRVSCNILSGHFA